VVTFRALETAAVITGRARRDAIEPHTALASWTTRALDGNEGGFGASMRLRHEMHPLDLPGAQYALSPLDAEGGGDGTIVMHGAATRWSILLISEEEFHPSFAN
jgi:hypothetical protein